MKKGITSTLLASTCLLALSATSAFATENETSSPAIGSQQVQASSSETSSITPLSADTGVINTDGVRIRSSPNLSGTVRGLLYKGNVVEISDTKYYGSGYTWYYVLSIDTGVSGYVASQYITVSK